MKYMVSGEAMDGTEIENVYSDYNDAASAAGVIIEEGGYAHLTNEDGNEYQIF